MSRRNRLKFVNDEAARVHFDGFIRAFIAHQFQARWRHILIDNPSKTHEELYRFEHHYHKDRCRPICHASWLSLLENDLADVGGLFFDGYASAVFLTGKQLAARFTTDLDDAIWSIVPGVNAIVFSHEGNGWHCLNPGLK